MFTRDSISGLVCLVISLVMLFMTLALPPASMVPIGPAFYPRIVLIVTALLSLTLVVIDLRTARTSMKAPAATQAGPAPNYRLVLITFVLFGLFIGLLPKLGFRISTFLFVFALQIALEWPPNAKRWLLVIFVAIATSAACHLVFEDYLQVLLPRGTWSGM